VGVHCVEDDQQPPGGLAVVRRQVGGQRLAVLQQD
jgi:hypothetical protein